MRILYFIFVFLVICNTNAYTYDGPSCESKIYCDSEFLKDVQLARIYDDSKKFVDMKLKYNESEILDKYQELKNKFGGKVPPNQDLKTFINETLENGNELQTWYPTDFIQNPSIINYIKDHKYKLWASRLNRIWNDLGKKVIEDVEVNSHLYSLIYVPNGFIIPGGRFTELYYWDTYWIVNGLLLCDMKATARGIIENIISIVRKYGFMPNGGRVYYLKRTQPPMLTMMALSYYEKTGDFDFIKSIMHDLESEFEFWIKNRTVDVEKNGKSYKMVRFYAPSKGPRPESYREDYEVAEQFKTEEEKKNFYTNIKSGAETGWDFSSRWFITANGSDRGNLSDIQTSSIIPVDLNCILEANARILNLWNYQMGNKIKASKYNDYAQQFLAGIQEVMWRPDKGTWFDWDLINHKHRENFYVSNIVPLWTGSYNMPKKVVANAVLDYLKKENIIEHDLSIRFNGTPTSMYLSSQQWDFPNAWPPLQAFIIQGLDRTQQQLAQEVASKLADVWLRSNYKGFAEKSMMFEKYDVTRSGETGGGGEYTPQSGFGWTNGVILELLNRFGNTAYYASGEN